MIFTTPTQFAVLALCLVAGWLFGRASGGRGARERARLRELEAEHAAYRRDAEARVKAAEVDRERVTRTAPVAPAVTGVRPAREM
ncbi:hypothetical protein SAMN06297144_0062 [Sphingomonas guangdongensis]|uniref:Uncharacterized protein n=1 Tax=Sphingomonas guangdongensis TaxID=1141890 RepID=A0A285Q9P5_9SPHN|nr:hypothetical protein [Sphingomonas guangdongensis]SOB78556.1 hypothetical protein SAMN06297144_0062 [Sphingomonas guangdongensis]